MMGEDLPPVKSMEAVDIHLRMIVRELQDIKGNLGQLATKSEVERQVNYLQKQIDDIKPRSLLRRATEVFVAVTTLAAAAGVLVAVVKWARL